jgi:DNA-binding MarR family transcriptional regulator
VVNVSVTPTGTARHAEVAERRGQLMAHVLGAFEPEEREQLADLLERLVGSVDDFLTTVAPAS